ncbi:FixH family protein [Aurantiacibacter sp. MUD11]|uniref:FixH family protein n=1 Tax=Aurantiacibacter sp. MUD11 TaxID=3003265 RepID=UPI0022AA7743|nr:FixH family protein [Aurantiacibacter sp. MUD11]WAT18181.1 FixH family protein [Aurantiacibacter sp. MUD11]
MARKFTGWHMTAILVAFFGTVAAVNFSMARYATGTFGGVVVENSYVASQEFNTWLEQAEASKALGWNVVTARRDDGRLLLSVSDAPQGLRASATARHPLGRQPDQSLAFSAIGEGQYLSDQPLPDGRWTVRLQLESGADTWRDEVHLQ